MRIVENEEKFKELVLYISQQCATDPTFGSVKLNKILYYSDFFSYARTGEAITGVEYQKLPNGPAPRKLLPIRKAMIEDRSLGIQEVHLQNGRVQMRTINLRKPNLKLFTAEEIALVDYVIRSLKSIKAKDVSDISHRMVGWLVTSVGATIPYGTVFLSNEPLSETENQRGRELASLILASAA